MLFITAFSGCLQFEQSNAGIIESQHVNSKLSFRSDDFVQVFLTDEEVAALAVDRKGTYKISESEAIDKLDRFSISNGKRITSTKSIVLKKSQKTGKNLYYEITFENSSGDGFALVSADERVSKVLCYTEHGSISDTVYNKNLNFCLQLVDLYVEEKTKEELEIGTLVSSANEKLGIGNKGNSDMSILRNRAVCSATPNFTETVSERLNFVPSGWHQNPPFNDSMPLVNINQKAKVGCMMLSVSQIMAYHKRPFKNYITTGMWPNIIDNCSTSVELKRLMRDAFDAMVVVYGITGTESNMIKTRDFLNNNGFIAGSETNYSYSGVWSAMYYGPTLIAGEDRFYFGHAWVVDGARTITTDEYLFTFLPPDCVKPAIIYQGSYDTDYIHHEWGHVGSYSSWTLSNVFDVSIFSYENVVFINYIQ